MKRNKRSKGRKGLCIKCFTFTEVQNHHYLPKRNFRMKEYKMRTIRLCSCCHREIEDILPVQKLKCAKYIAIHRAWLRDEPIPQF